MLRSVALLTVIAFASASTSSVSDATTTTRCPNLNTQNIKNYCLKTNQRQCGGSAENSPFCKMEIEKIINDANCVSDMLDLGKKYGFSDTMICNWRAPCDIQSIPGITCTDTAEPASKAFSTKFAISFESNTYTNSAICGADKYKWVRVIAKTLSTEYINVHLPNCEATRLLQESAHRNLAAVTLNAQVFADIQENADALRNNAALTDFSTRISAAVAAEASLVIPGFANLQVSPPTTTTASNSFVAPKYKEGTGVKGFRKWSVLKSGATWTVDRKTPTGKKYTDDLAKFAISSIVVVVVIVIFYCLFLIIRSCCCCKRCTTVQSAKASCCTPKQSKITLAVLFLLCIIVMSTAFDGHKKFKDGVDGTIDTVRKTSSLFTDLTSDIKTFQAEANKFSAIANGNHCTRSTATIGNTADSSLQAVSSSFTSAATSMGNNIDASLSKKIDDPAKDIKNIADDYIHPAIVAVNVCFIMIAVVGLLSVSLHLSGMNTGAAPRILLYITYILSVLILLVVGILLTIELTAGVALADFCAGSAADINKNILEVVKITGETKKQFEYYLTCDGGEQASPVYKHFSDARFYLKTIKSQAKTLDESGICSTTEMKKIYEDTNGIVDKSLVVVGSFEQKMSCSKSINKLVTKLLHDDICGDIVDGFYGSFNVHVVGAVLLLCTMIFADFVRPHYSPEVGQASSKKNGDSPVSFDETDAVLGKGMI